MIGNQKWLGESAESRQRSTSRKLNLRGRWCLDEMKHKIPSCIVAGTNTTRRQRSTCHRRDFLRWIFRPAMAMTLALFGKAPTRKLSIHRDCPANAELLKVKLLNLFFSTSIHSSFLQSFPQPVEQDFCNLIPETTSFWYASSLQLRRYGCTDILQSKCPS